MMISDEDIEHLHRTVDKALEIIKKILPGSKIEGLEPLKELISADTLKALQLLGFNFRTAIGEPLTQLCANAIVSKDKNVKRN